MAIGLRVLSAGWKFTAHTGCTWCPRANNVLKDEDVLYRLVGNSAQNREEDAMFTILLVVLVLMLLGALPTWPYSRGWGYYPSGGLGLVVVILVVLLLVGRI